MACCRALRTWMPCSRSRLRLRAPPCTPCCNLRMCAACAKNGPPRWLPSLPRCVPAFDPALGPRRGWVYIAPGEAVHSLPPVLHRRAQLRCAALRASRAGCTRHEPCGQHSDGRLIPASAHCGSWLQPHVACVAAVPVRVCHYLLSLSPSQCVTFRAGATACPLVARCI